MNKKGFTLIELLAVIAIVSILAIVVIPNVVESVKKSRRNTFLTEAREVYKAAERQYVYDKAKGFNTIKYQRGYNIYSGSDVKELDLTGRSDYDYLVVINASGNIVYFLVEDGNHKIELGDNSNEVLFKDIK